MTQADSNKKQDNALQMVQQWLTIVFKSLQYIHVSTNSIQQLRWFGYFCCFWVVHHHTNQRSENTAVWGYWLIHHHTNQHSENTALWKHSSLGIPGCTSSYQPAPLGCTSSYQSVLWKQSSQCLLILVCTLVLWKHIIPSLRQWVVSSYQQALWKHSSPSLEDNENTAVPVGGIMKTQQSQLGG